MAIATAVAVLGMGGPAFAAFPYKQQLPGGANQGPNDLAGGKVEWMYASTPEAGTSTGPGRSCSWRVRAAW